MTPPAKPYRSEIDALRERKETLERELARVREQAQKLETLKAEEATLEQELAAVEGRLRDGGAQRRLPLLDQVRIASPCNAAWSDMVGDERVRFCLSCEKDVFNLSAMSASEAEALLAERLGKDLCVRFFQRADGTVMTQDCPEGVKKKRRKLALLSVAGAGAVAAAAVASAFSSEKKCQRTMGQVTVRETVPTATASATTPVPIPTTTVREVKGEPERVPAMGAIAIPLIVEPKKR